MPESRFTSLARLRSLMLRYGQALGLDRREMLSRARLSESDLEDPDARLSLESGYRLWRILIAHDPGRAHGIDLVRSTSLKEYGLVGYAMFFSPDLRSALRRLVRYIHIVNDGLDYGMREGPILTEFSVSAGKPRIDALKHPVDARLANVVTAARELTQASIVPEEVWFPYPQPDRLEEHRNFFRCRLVFGRPEPTLLLKTSDLDRTVAAADPSLGGYLDQLARDALISLANQGSTQDLLDRVLLRQLSGGQPSLQRASKAMGVGARTIQRRLKAERTSFSEVLDHLRRQVAISLLEDPHHSIGEVAFFLGYSEASAFHRAFRRWTGQSPQEFRRARGGREAVKA